jgi:hypothetical protein
MRDEYPPLDPEQGHSCLAWLFLIGLTVAGVVVGYVVLRSWLP